MNPAASGYTYGYTPQVRVLPNPLMPTPVPVTSHVQVPVKSSSKLPTWAVVGGVVVGGVVLLKALR